MPHHHTIDIASAANRRRCVRRLHPHRVALMANWSPYLLVGLGGFFGANARFLLARAIGATVDTPFPLGTFIINIAGSFLLGVVGTIVARQLSPESESLRLALGVGFLGAFTTFSTFEFETHGLLEVGSWLLAGVNMIGSLVVGLIALRLGVVITRAWLG